MKKKSSIPIIMKRAAKNTVRLKNQSILMFLICFISAFLALFATLLFNCASLLSSMTNLPYMDSYMYVMNSEDFMPPVVNDQTYSMGMHGIKVVFPMFDIVEEVLCSSERDINLDIKQITSDFEVSETAGATFYFYVIPDSEYHQSFVKGERVLIKGRHLTTDDYRNESNYVLIDKELAEINELDVGGKLKDEDGAEFEVVGIYQTAIPYEEVDDDIEVPNNYIFSSKSSNAIQTHDIGGINTVRIMDEYLYVRFKEGVGKKTIENFFSDMEKLGYTGKYNNNGYIETYSFLSVEEVNRANNMGIHTVLRIAAVSLVSVFLITAAAVYMFSSMIASSRRKEILLQKALGEKRGNITATVLLELIYVMLPAIALGILSCIFLARDYVRELFIRFASQMTPVNMRSTSSILIDAQEDMGKLVIRYTESTDMPVIAAVIFSLVLVITAACIVLRIRALLDEKTISLMNERRY